MSRYLSGSRECKSYLLSLIAKKYLTHEYSMIILALYSLVIAHPGPIFAPSDANIYESNVTATSNGFTEKEEPGMAAREQDV